MSDTGTAELIPLLWRPWSGAREVSLAPHWFLLSRSNLLF